uniref:Uncharacterized protein n=1 Tax=Timema monikensis TaxID=170555 RepID=A0A7R9EAX8_9NEOP|nr:unnamed protein product [Timema monikensis]
MEITYSTVPCVVENCGELQPGSDWGLAENDGTPDKYPPFPEDWELSTKLKVERVEEVITNIKDSGNYYFSIKNYTDANRKYKKAIRYIDCSRAKGLLIDSKCAKAFYRRGQARIGLNDYEMALKDLKTALLLVPNNKSIKLEIISLRNRMRNYLLLEKVRFEKMLKCYTGGCLETYIHLGNVFQLQPAIFVAYVVTNILHDLEMHSHMPQDGIWSNTLRGTQPTSGQSQPPSTISVWPADNDNLSVINLL